ncbi:hypothetical protein D3C78_1602800 [compost metagenome]
MACSIVERTGGTLDISRPNIKAERQIAARASLPRREDTAVIGQCPGYGARMVGGNGLFHNAMLGYISDNNFG